MQHTHSVERRILLSRLLTRTGDQAWDFAVPITLVSIFPTQISLVALIYLFSKLGSVLLQPWLSSVIDRWRRIRTAVLGTSLQFMSVLLTSTAIVMLSIHDKPNISLWHQPQLVLLVVAVICGSVVSNLGSGLMDIAVGNDWIPVAVSSERLPVVNSRLKQLDLFTEVVSPVVSGLLLALSIPSFPLAGFLIVALWNIASFAPELLLLKSVFLGSQELQGAITVVEYSGKMGLFTKLTSGWHEFRRQPAALVMLAYAFLWLSALSPHGVLLTSFLKRGWSLSEWSLGIFRGLGAVFGLAATLIYPFVRKRFGLVRASQHFLIFQAGILLFSLPFFYLQSAHGWIFLFLILLSRVGLYGFSLGETEIRQRTIPEGKRGTTNGVATSLTSLATLILFSLGAFFSETDRFFVMVMISAGSVCVGALVFTGWAHRTAKEAT